MLLHKDSAVLARKLCSFLSSFGGTSAIGTRSFWCAAGRTLIPQEEVRCVSGHLVVKGIVQLGGEGEMQQQPPPRRAPCQAMAKLQPVSGVFLSPRVTSRFILFTWPVDDEEFTSY